LPRSLPASEPRLDPPCDEPLRLSRDACDRLLPSTSSTSSTRASFASDEIASPTREMFGLANGARLEELPPVGGRSKSPAFHDARPASACRWFAIYLIARTWRRFLPPRAFAIGRASDAPVAPPARCQLERSLSQRSTPAGDAEIGRRRFREETAALRPSAPSVERCFFINTTSCDAAPRSPTGLGPGDCELARFARFCRRVTGRFALSNRLDSTPLFDGEGSCRP